MAQTKATKKFEKKHLKDTIQRRKEFAKIKQRHQLKEKKKAKKARENDGEAPAKDMSEASGKQFEHMTVDEFFQGGFEIPEEQGRKKNSKSKDVPAKTGKRKRTTTEEDEDSDESPAASVEAFPAAGGTDSEGESDVGSEEGHMRQLEDLKTKDPEFYKLLEREDPDLLGGFKEVDQLSEDEEQPKKKQKTEKSKDEEESEDASNELTMIKVSNWEEAMIEKKSLRSMREVIIAFRSAAHLNEESGKIYKYSVSNPDGTAPSITSL